MTLVDVPESIGLKPTENFASDNDPIILQEVTQDNPEEEAVVAIPRQVASFSTAWRIPGVCEYAICFFAIKLVNYSFFFWLPYYFHNNYEWTEVYSNKVSILFDVGGIVGGIAGGVGSDVWGHRSPVVFLMTLLSIPCLVGILYCPNSQSIVSLITMLSGVFVGGAANIVGGACSVDLGKTAKSLGLHSAVPIVTGIVDGTGSIGAAIGQLAIPYLEEELGWNSVFYIFIAFAILSSLSLCRLIYRDVLSIYLHR